MSGVETHDWDVIAAITYADVNAAIDAQGSSPQSFDVTSQDGSSTLSGRFGPWRLTTGGAGSLLHIEAPILEARASYNGAELPMDPTVARLLVHAEFLPQPDSVGKRNLVLRTSPRAEGEIVVTVEGPSPAQSTTNAEGKVVEDFLRQTLMKSLIEQWANANLDAFNHVFAVADLELDLSASPGLTWMTPWHLGYAVQEPAINPTVDNAVFAVLALVDEPAGDDEKSLRLQNLAYEVDLGAIPPGRKAGLVISGPQFVRQFIYPTMPHVFAGLENTRPEENFTISNGGITIRNHNELKLDAHKLEEKTLVDPVVPAETFSMELVGTELRIRSENMWFEYSPGIFVYLSFHTHVEVFFDENIERLQITKGEVISDGHAEMSDALQGLMIGLLVIGIVTAVAGGVAGAISKSATTAVEEVAQGASITVTGAARTAALAAEEASIMCGRIVSNAATIETIGARAAVIGGVAGVGGFVLAGGSALTEVLKTIADNDFSAVPDIADLTNLALGEGIRFSGMQDYRIAEAGLNGALIFGLEHA